MLGGLTLGTGSYRRLFTHGVVAQLGERLNGIQEVRGSIPLSSTIKKPSLRTVFFMAKLILALNPRVCEPIENTRAAVFSLRAVSVC